MAKAYSSGLIPFGVSLNLAIFSSRQVIEILVFLSVLCQISNYNYSIDTLEVLTSCMGAFELVMQKLGS
jgi:hypothetical protein